MKIVINGFNDIDANKKSEIISFLHDLVSELSKNLDIRNLDYILVSEDFGRCVTDFQRKHGLQEGYTDNDTGNAKAKCLEYLIEGELRNCIIVDGNMILLLYSDEAKFAVHLIHHELCHVHDNNVKLKSLSLEFSMRQHGDLFTCLKLHADCIWSEYIATRLSCSSHPEALIMYAEHLYELINLIKDKNENYVAEYRWHGDIDRLYGEIQLSSSALLKSAAMIYGYIQGIGDMGAQEFDEIKKIMSEKIASTYFFDVWNCLQLELDGLFDNYGNWDGIEVFNGLADTVLNLWNIFSIFPEIVEGGRLYIGVP